MKDLIFMSVAMALREASTCPRRKVACLLLDSYYRIIGSGYNGAPRGQEHCPTDPPCCGTTDSALEHCRAVHAEQNALIQCSNPDLIWTAVVTTLPCFRCLKMLMNTTCYRIVYCEPHSDVEAIQELWPNTLIRIQDGEAVQWDRNFGVYKPMEY